MELIEVDEQRWADRRVENAPGNRVDTGTSSHAEVPRYMRRGDGSPRDTFPPRPPDRERRIWVGGIPDELVPGISTNNEESETSGESVSVSLNCKLGRCFERFGKLVALTLRRKPGRCKSWALATFEQAEAAKAALAANTQYGTPPVTLIVKREDIEQELRKPTTGALAGAARQQKEAEDRWMQQLLGSLSPRAASGAKIRAKTARAPRDAAATMKLREQSELDKRARVSVETQMAIATEQLKEAARSTDLHRIAAALSAARSLAQQHDKCTMLKTQADQVESQLREKSPDLGKKLDLRGSSLVQHQVQRLWDVLLLECTAPDENDRRKVNEDGYCKLHICINKAVSEEDGWDLTEAHRYAKTDWDDDVDRFSNEAGINAWLTKVKVTMQANVASSVEKFGWQAIFASLDENGDGQVDCAEFIAGLRSAGLDARMCRDDEIREMFRSVDVDGGGEIDGKEFADWLGMIRDLDKKVKAGRAVVDRPMQASIRAVRKLQEKTSTRVADLGWRKLFESVDTDGNGELDVGEFVVALRKHGLSQSDVSDSELAEVFKLIDTDAGGSLSSAEFVAALRQEETSGYTMTFSAFEASMFELVDFWSDSATEDAYVLFFETLFRAITELMPGVQEHSDSVFSSTGAANYRLKDAKYIESLLNVDGKFDAQKLPDPNGQQNEVTPHPPPKARHNARARGSRQHANKSAERQTVQPWRAGRCKSAAPESQSLGPNVPVPLEKTDWALMLAAITPPKSYTFRPTQRFVSVLPRPTSPRRRVNSGDMPARPHTTTAARGDYGNFDKACHSHRRRRTNMGLHPCPPRRVTLRERMMFDSRAVSQRGGKKQPVGRAFLLAPLHNR